MFYPACQAVICNDSVFFLFNEWSQEYIRWPIDANGLKISNSHFPNCDNFRMGNENCFQEIDSPNDYMHWNPRVFEFVKQNQNVTL